MRENRDVLSDESTTGSTEIVCHRGAINRYEYNYDLVVLDSRLSEYPMAREVIKQHELEHADAKTAREYIRHEFQSDARLYFSTADEMEEVRQYYDEIEPDYTFGRLTLAGVMVADVLRSLWTSLMSPLGYLYREYWCRTGGSDNSPETGGCAEE